MAGHCAIAALRRAGALFALLALLAPLAPLFAQRLPPRIDDAEFARRKEHWAWQPLQDEPPPPVRDADWPQDPLDDFVLARLEADGLRPAPQAPPAVWLRRVWFDLAGLPPPPDAVAAFAADPSRAARARVVDGLLGSPHFAERWARHWLDLVRYAETLGHEFDFQIPNAWRYRDWVIRALDQDLPFDRFGTEQIAGDLLADPRIDAATGSNESVQGTAFWWFAEQTHAPLDVRQHQADRIDNQVDVLGKAFLGMTVACARCHDHKFDAIRSADYYSLYGFVKSSRYVQQPLYRTPQALAERAQRAATALASLAPADASATPAASASAATALPPLRDGERLFADCGGEPLPGFAAIGDAFGGAPLAGPFVCKVGAEEGDRVRVRELPGRWRNSSALGPAREGVLTTPDFTIEAPFVHVEVAGERARAVLILEGFHLVREPLYADLHRSLGDGAPRWVTFPVDRWQGRRAHLQFVDQRAAGLADPDHETGEWPPDGWIAVRRIVFSPHAEPPPPPGALLRDAELDPADPAVATALASFRRAERALPPTDTLPGMADGSGEDEYVFVRGSHRQPGAVAPRRFLEAVAGAEPFALPCGSGRLQLAESIFAAGDPLPARVFVNRVWHHLFGRGLVRSVDNFGQLGDRPSHAALLDRLALDAVRSGWSWKRLIRRLALSSTYAMASTDADPRAAAADPDNALLHRQNLRRLEAEPLRDALLAFGDRLDGRRFGPPVPVPLDEGENARGKPQVAGPADGRGRRSIYLAVPRNFLDEFLLAFDLPTPFATVGARNVSNVPAQSLALFNDPFVQGMSRLAAEHLFAAGPASPRARLDRLFVAAFARPATDDEAEPCLRFVADAAAGGPDPVAAWAALAHVLVNRKEFQFLQ